MLCSPFPPQTGGAQVILRMQVAVTPTATDRSAITTPKGTSPGLWLLELPQSGGDRHRQRQFESPSDQFQLTVTHFMSSGLKRILSPFVDSRHDTRRPLSAAPSRPPLLPSVALAPPFLVLDAIFSSNKISGRANQIFEPRFFCRWVVRAEGGCNDLILECGSFFQEFL